MTAKIKLNAASGGGSVSIVAPTSTTSNANVELKLPIADGSSDQVIKTDGSGNLSFGAGKAPKVFSMNGAMRLAQYSTNATNISTSGYYCADRMKMDCFTGSERYSNTLETDAPAGQGFTKSLKIKTTTADTSPNTGTYAKFMYQIEGYNLQSLLKGTSSAKPLTISFWCKGNTNYTPVAELKDNTNTRINVQTFNVTTSWTKVVLTYVGDTTGAFGDVGTAALSFSIWLKASAFYSGGTAPTQNTWVAQSNQNIRAALLTFDIAASTDNYFQITGLQIEEGDTANDFVHENLEETLKKCQRYFYLVARQTGSAGADETCLFNMAQYTGTQAYGVVPFPCPMRTNPTLVQTTGTDFFRGFADASPNSFDSFTLIRSNKSCAEIRADGFSASGGEAVFVRTNANTASVAFSAEL